MRLGRISAPPICHRAPAACRPRWRPGIAVQAPPDFGREPLLAVHSADYLDYLEHAYARWQALKGPGVDPGRKCCPNLSLT